MRSILSFPREVLKIATVPTHNLHTVVYPTDHGLAAGLILDLKKVTPKVNVKKKNDGTLI